MSAPEERPATDAERAIAPGWEEWAMDCLDTQQISHCGHLDTALISPGCPYCAEWVAHATHTRAEPVPACGDCTSWLLENRSSLELLSAYRLSLGRSAPDELLHSQVEHRGQMHTLLSVDGKRDEPWAATACLRDAAGRYSTVRLVDLLATPAATR